MSNTKYPMNVCMDCGFVANHLTMLKRYGGKSLQPSFEVMTMHTGICDVCSQEKTVTSPRDFFYPTKRAFDCIRRYIMKGKDE